MKKSSIIFVCIIALMLSTAGIAGAFSSYLNQFNAEYGTSGTALDSCIVCHNSANSPGSRNSFGQDWSNFGFGATLEGRDSDGDGVINITEIEDGFFPGNASSTPPVTSPAPQPFCGDGVVDTNEACDDGNNVDGDGCSADCLVERVPGCGDGILDSGEICDDGNNVAGDGCRGNCTEELCGDGIVDPQENCDDGNTVDGDGCSANCTIERVTPPVNPVPPPVVDPVPPPAGNEDDEIDADDDDDDNEVRDRRPRPRRDRRERRSSDSDD